MHKRLLLILAFLTLTFNASAYVRNPEISEEVWNKLTPYFLPEDLPVKKQLDKIFSKSRITLNRDTLEKAKFKKPKHRKVSKCVVSGHPNLKGYLVKLFTDDQIDKNDWQYWKRRVDGAKAIQNAITKHGFHRFF